MKSRNASFFLWLLGVSLVSAQGKYTLQDFSLSLNALTSEPQHVWVNSGYTTVQPEFNTVMGVGEFYSPPFAAKDLRLQIEFQVDTLRIADTGSRGKGDVGLLYAGGTWYPHKVVRKGTYHHLKNNRLISLAVTSELIPLYEQHGFVQKVQLTNRSPQTVRASLSVRLDPGHPTHVPLSQWGYGQPKAKAGSLEQISPSLWKTAEMQIGLLEQNTQMELSAGDSSTAYVAVLLVPVDQEFPLRWDGRRMEEKTIAVWKQRLARYTKNIPTLNSTIAGLESYYKRSVLSGLVCIWENSQFKVNPHLATGGMDGGVLCCYLWDSGGYAPRMVTCMLDSAVIPIARQMVAIDLENYYAFTPGGEGIGVRYSYSPNVFMHLVSSIARFLRPDEQLLTAAKELILGDELKQDLRTHLIDYGKQVNLLEMRGSGYEHFVVSPNAERVWCLNELAEWGAVLGWNTAQRREWREKAELIQRSLRRELWDEEVRWWRSVYPNGYVDHVYSIQGFDALPTGVCSDDMIDAMLSHLRPGAFLGDYGITSVSAADNVHYEVVDTDWSGGGAYTGDGPQLALHLYGVQRSELAWDILKRHFWMGKHLLYYPQEHYCDRPESPAHKRANVVAGLGGAETVLFGLIGFQPLVNGQLWIHPQPTNEGSLTIQGFGYRGNRIDVELSTGRLAVTKNGLLLYQGPPKRLRII